MIRAYHVFREVLRGWAYLIGFFTVGNFARRAQLRRVGVDFNCLPTVTFKHPGLIDIGDHVFINHMSNVWAMAPDGSISIGNDVLIGPGVSIVASNHGIALDEPIRLQPIQTAPIVIEDDVWLCANVVVTAGVRIGRGCVVAAGAVVTRDLPPYSICAGLPAAVVGQRHSSSKVDAAVTASV